MSDVVTLGPGLPSLPVDLMVARDQGRVLFVVGAGASYPAPSNLPGFRGLVQNIFAILDPTMSEPMAEVSKPGGPSWSEAKAPLNDFQRTELKFFAAGEYDVALGRGSIKRTPMRRSCTSALAASQRRADRPFSTPYEPFRNRNGVRSGIALEGVLIQELTAP